MKLWKHQEKGVELARRVNDVALFFEPGTGKTGTLITALREDFNRHKKIANTLVFAPLSVCRQWKGEFALFAPKLPQERILVLTGTGLSRVKALAAKRAAGLSCIVVTNYEAVQIKTFYEELLSWGPEIIVCDESHRLKDSGSARAKKIYPLCAGARRRFLLTGTPILNSLLDIYGQYKALSPGTFGPSFWKFRQKYFYDKNAGMPAHLHFPDWRPIPEAEKMISSVISASSIQAKKSECLDLPPLIETKIPIELSSEQRKIYTMMEKEFVAELKGVVSTAEFAMTKTLRLQQILAGFVQDEADQPAAWVDDCPRLRGLHELLESLGGRKTIIWTTFRPSYQRIGDVAHRLGLSYAFLTGEQSTLEKERAIHDFNHGSTSVLIANAAAGGVGVNLASAQYAIYYGRSYSLEHFLQSKARNYRGGSERHESVTHFHLVAEGTLDEAIWEALQNKKSTGDALLEWARKKTLDTKSSQEHSNKQGDRADGNHIRTVARTEEAQAEAVADEGSQCVFGADAPAP